MVNQISQLFEPLIKKVNATPQHRKFIREWVGPHLGKILQLETDEGVFHIIIDRKGRMRLEKGSYPSPDVIYKANTQTLLNLFTGQADLRDLMRRWELIIIGAGHESVPLANLLLRVIRSS